MYSSRAMRSFWIILPSGLFFLFCLLGDPVLGDPDDPALGDPGQYVGSTTVVAVEVPVNVVQDGEPVRGLTMDDFEILDRGEQRPLLGFEVIDLETIGLTPASTEVPAVAQRHFLLFFDLAYSRTKALKNSIRGSRELTSSLHPTDRVAVAIFGLSGGARVLLNFTTDQKQVSGVLDVLEDLLDRDLEIPDAEPGDDGAPVDPLRLVAADAAALTAEIGRAAGIEYSGPEQALRRMVFLGGGRNTPDLQHEIIVDMDDRVTKELKSRQQSEALALTSSFEAIADLAQGVDGRKYLVYFSEGFEGYMLEGRGSAKFLRDLHKTFNKMRETDWMIQSVDAGGVRAHDEQFNTTGSLVLLARETGGDIYQNFNNLGSAMESILERTGVTYLLVFQSPEIAQDGSFHPIKVKLKNRRGQVRHRAGYYAPNPGEKGTSGLLSTGEMILSGEEGGALGLAALVTPLRGPDGEGNDVSIWIEADGRDLLAAFDGPSLELELFVYALSESGQVRDFLTQTFGLEASRVRERLSQGGNFKFHGDLRLAPGQYDLRVLLKAKSDQRYGLRSVPVRVKDLSGQAPHLLGPVVFDDPRLPSVVVREPPTLGPDGSDPSYPFRVGDGQYYPAVRPALTRGQTARISLLAYQIEGLLLKTATVVGRDGAAVPSGQLDVVGKDAHDGLDQIFFDFQPQELEPGEYSFEIALVDPKSEATYTSSLAFELVK